MLRGEVDMLYEVGQDALDSLQPSSNVKVFTYERPYAYVLVPNMQRPAFRDAGVQTRVERVHRPDARSSPTFSTDMATPADGPVPPNHWAYDPEPPTFKYEPKQLVRQRQRPRFTCSLPDASLERLALLVQRQLQAVGVDLELELVAVRRVQREDEVGDFDVVLADAALGPTMLRAYRFWHSGERSNFGRFSSKKVDGALDSHPRRAGRRRLQGGRRRRFSRRSSTTRRRSFWSGASALRAVSTPIRGAGRAGAGHPQPAILRLWRPVDDRTTDEPRTRARWPSRSAASPRDSR